MGIMSKFTKNFTEAYRNLLGFYEDPISKSYNEQIYDIQQTQMNNMMDLQKSEAKGQQKALLENPLGTLQAMNYKDRAFSLSYDILKKMATKDAVIGAIINTRINQVSSFTSPARYSNDGIGFEITLRDPNEAPTKEDEEMFLAIETFLENTGYEKDNSRDDFDTFLRKIVRDRLTYDQATFEIIPDVKGRPAEFIAVDGSTIRIASEKLNELGNKRELGIKNSEEIKYVQVIDGEIRAYFTATELAFCIANPRTDIEQHGYGLSELEMLVHQITSHLWAEQYNSKFFSQGGTTKGILNFKASNGVPVNPEQLEAFKRQWLSQVSGMTGAWKTPVVSAEGLEYINVSQSNREMEFEKWLNYLINICCAVFQIDPAEVNFPNRGGATGSSGGGLGDGGIEDRLAHSKDKGLRPLLRYIEAIINKHIVSRFSTRYVFSFVGLDRKSESEKADQRAKDVKTYRTINEIRKDEGLEPLENGDILLDPSYIQYLSQKAQQEQQEKMMAQGGGMMGGFGGQDNEEEEDDDDWNYDDEEDDYDEDESEDEKTEKSLKFIKIELED